MKAKFVILTMLLIAIVFFSGCPGTIPPTNTCGNNVCEASETISSCPKDCSKITIEEDSIEEGKLLLDLDQQSVESDFIYSLWLGRGFYTKEEIDRGFDLARNLGVKYFKVEFKWGAIEPTDDEWVWDSSDKNIDVDYIAKLAKENNLSIIPYFEPFMPWGETKHLDPKKGECEGMATMLGQKQAPDPNEYAEYVLETVKRLNDNGADVKYIEIDNENSQGSDGYSSKSCFFNATAKEIKEYQNAAYDLVKENYPEIMLSSTTFGFPGLSCSAAGEAVCEKDKANRNSFLKAYFEESPKPKFDFLAIHEVLGGTGNPFTQEAISADANYEYNLGSYNDAYDMYREMLDNHGFENTPIFNTESAAVQKGIQDAELIQRAVFSRINSSKNNVMGWILSQLTGSKKFTEQGNGETFLVGITDLTEEYDLREGYYGYYVLMSILPRYPIYEKNILGEINCENPWAEKFTSENGKSLYIIFLPYSVSSDDLTDQKITLKISPDQKANVTKSDSKKYVIDGSTDPENEIAISTHPIFIEVDESETPVEITSSSEGTCVHSSKGIQKPAGDGTNSGDPTTKPCGDGVCDSFEKTNPQLCPTDCQGSSAEEIPIAGDEGCVSKCLATGKNNVECMSQCLCGDGTCDAIESANNVCPADCS